MKQYDVIVIGTGAGNTVLEGALAKGLKCAQIEKGKFGGTCLTRGCIPTKVMVTAADYIREIEKMERIGVEVGSAKMNWARVSERLWKKIDESQAIKEMYESREGVDVYQGTGYFTGKRTIQVQFADGTQSEEMTAPMIFLNVGGRTKVNSIKGLEDVGYITSESFFGEKYPKTPYESLIIMGGGPIGTEFAHALAAAGTKVTLIQHNKRLLPKEDEEISAQILKDILALGIDVRVNAEPEEVFLRDGQKVLRFSDRDTGVVTEVMGEEILMASGIRPNSDLLHLEKTDIETDSRGWIRTNEFLETTVEGIWALGDINGQAPFRHKANYEADILVHNLFSDNPPKCWRWARYDLVPAVTYTYPQAAHVGLTEAEARKAGYDVKTAKNYYSASAKGFAMGFTPNDPHDGFVKVVADRPTNTILGVHIIGPEASILIQPFINLMNAGETPLIPVNEDIASLTVQQLRKSGIIRILDPHSILSIGETMTPHPSLSEVTMWTQYYYEGKV